MHWCKCNGVADLLKHVPLQMCYQAEVGCYALKDVRRIQENPKIAECCSMPNGTVGVIKKIHLKKNLIHRVVPFKDL